MGVQSSCDLQLEPSVLSFVALIKVLKNHPISSESWGTENKKNSGSFESREEKTSLLIVPLQN